MLEVGILYADKVLVTEKTPVDLVRYTLAGLEYVFPLSQDWKPFTGRKALRRDGVLGITITNERGTRSAMLPRMWNRHNRFDAQEPWVGGDTYVIGILGDNLFTDQYDDMEDRIYLTPLADPLIRAVDKTNILRAQRWPAEADVTLFRGVWIPMPEWDKAIKVFDNEIF